MTKRATMKERHRLPPSQRPSNSRRSSTRRGARMPNGDWTETLTRVMDEAIPIPGTNLRIGLDSILGFVFPGAGDTLTGMLSLALLIAAVRERLPAIALMRIALNVAFDTLIGTIPIVGDLFDVGFKANRRNLEILRRYRARPGRRPSSSDYVAVLGAFTIVIAAIALPLALFIWALSALFAD